MYIYTKVLCIYGFCSECNQRVLFMFEVVGDVDGLGGSEMLLTRLMR